MLCSAVKATTFVELGAHKSCHLSWKSEGWDLQSNSRFGMIVLAYLLDGRFGFLLFKTSILETLNISFLLLPKQIITNFVASSNTNLLFYSSRGLKCEICLAWLKSGYWQCCVPFWRFLGKNLLSYSFQLLEYACILWIMAHSIFKASNDWWSLSHITPPKLLFSTLLYSNAYASFFHI